MPFRYIIFLLFPLLSMAQVAPRNLLQKSCSSCLQSILAGQTSFRPFPRTSENWKGVLPDTVIQQLIYNGENALKENFPNVPATIALDFLRNGNRTRYETITFGKRNRLWNLVLAESIEGKKRFSDAIVNGIWSICEESFWGASAHLFLQKSGTGLPDVEDPVVDLFAAETAANLALADYFIGPELDSISPLIRRRIYYEVNRRIFVPMESAKYEWMGRGDKNARLNNWAPWIMSNYLTAVLFLEKDSARRIQYATRVMQLTDQYINGIGEDGACEEGPHYWDNAAGCVFDVLNLLFSATGGRVNIYNEKIIRQMGAYIYRTHIGGNYFVNVADSHPEENPESIMVWRFGHAVADTTLSSFGTLLFHKNGFNNSINLSFHRMRSLFDLLSLKSIIADKEIFHENAGSWLPDVQLMTARLSNGLFVAAHGGNNGESHNHNDVGDFIIYANGDPVIIDVGSGTYTAKTFSKDRYKLWFNTSAYHNLPTIDGQQQVEGSAHAATDVFYKKDKNQTTFVMDIMKAYPGSVGLGSWKRMITVETGKVLITDRYQSAKPFLSVVQSFMTVCNVDISKPGTIFFTTEHGDRVTLRYGAGWQVTKELVPLTTEEDQGLKLTWRNRPITRILLSHKALETSESVQYVITK